jgi:ferredoxin
MQPKSFSVFQHFKITREVRVIGKKRFVFWYACGTAFCGRACHMKAIKHARLNTAHTDKRRQQ